MKPVRIFTVVPKLPAPLSRLRELALNLNWAWNHDTIELFRRLDSDLWESSGHNPVMMLGRIEQRLLEEAAADDAFLAHLERVCRSFDGYIADKTSWLQITTGDLLGDAVCNRRYSQRAHAAICFRNLHSPHRRRKVAP